MKNLTRCFLMMILVSTVACPFAEGVDTKKLPRDISGFIPVWQVGNNWKLRISAIAMQHVQPKRESRDCQMSVIEVPEADTGRFVLKLLVDRSRECLFFMLDAKDLSLRELRRVRKNRIELEKKTTQNNAWEDAEVLVQYPGGVPVIIRTDFVHIAFPVLRPGDEVVYERPNEYVVLQKYVVETGNDEILVLNIAKSQKLVDARQRLSENKVDYKLVWKRGAPWWQSCIVLSKEEYRIEMVEQDE